MTQLALASNAESIAGVLGIDDSEVSRLLESGRMSAVGEFLGKILAVGSVVVPDEALLVPKGKRIFKRINAPDSRQFCPEDATLFFAEGQKEIAHTGAHILSVVSKTNHDKKLMGVEHLVFYLENWWRIPEKFKRYSVAFFGTVFAPCDKFADNLGPVDLFVWILDWDDEKGRPVIRIKPLSNNFDQHYPIAMAA